MGTKISPISTELRGLRRLASIAERSFLLTALLPLTVGFASAQIRPSEILKTNSPSQPYVTLNQLLTPDKAQKALEKARQDFMRGHIDSAQRETERALEVFPRCALALSIQGAVNLSQTNYADAGRHFQQAIEAEPTFGPAYLGLGMAYTSQGRFKDALIPLDRAASFLPGFWIVHFELAVAHLGLEEPETALREISYAERFTGTDPQKRAGVSYLRGMAHFELSGYREAQENFNEAVKRDSNGKFAVLAKGKLEQLNSLSEKRQIAGSSVYNPF